MQRYIDYDHTQMSDCQHGYKVSMKHRLQWFMRTKLVTSAWWIYEVMLYEKLLNMLLLILLL